MYVSTSKFASAVFLVTTTLGVSALLPGSLAMAQDKSRDLAWVEKRIRDWQPTKDERRFDQIGWAKDLSDALRLGKEKGRPIFVFTHKGHMQFGRC